MKREMFFAVTGIFAAVFGLGFLLVPEPSLSMYGVPTNPHNLMEARYFGSALLAVGIISYMARATTDETSARAILMGGLVMDIAGTLISVMSVGTLQNAMGWLSVAIYGVFAAGGAYLLFGVKPAAAAA